MQQWIDRLFAFVLVGLLAVTHCVATANASEPDESIGRIADFEGELPTGLTGERLRFSLSTDEPAEGKQSLRATVVAAVAVAKDSPAGVGLSLPWHAALQADVPRSLTASIRVKRQPSTPEKPVVLRWLALDLSDRPILQRRVTLEPGSGWQAVRVTPAQWRWGNDSAGSWSDVRRLQLAIESPVAEIGLDDLRFEPAAGGETSRADWLLALAFQERDVRLAEADGLLVATDAVGEGEISEADLKRMLLRMRQLRKFLRRALGKAIRPIESSSPAALLIFRKAEDHQAFWARLGDEWGATIAPPSSQGYTVQDIAASTFQLRLGADRPVYLHESVHAVLAHDARLLTGNVRHSWFHEAIANYVQVCVYPESLGREVYATHFATPISGEGKTFFKPLKLLLTRPATSREYAQLASLMAFLIEVEPGYLPKIAKVLAQGGSAEAALKECGTDFARLEAAWFAWGLKKYVDGQAEADAPAFDAPEELVSVK